MTPLPQWSIESYAECHGSRVKLAQMLDSHVLGKAINLRTVRRWVAGKAKPHPLLLE